MLDGTHQTTRQDNQHHARGDRHDQRVQIGESQHTQRFAYREEHHRSNDPAPDRSEPTHHYCGDDHEAEVEIEDRWLHNSQIVDEQTSRDASHCRAQSEHLQLGARYVDPKGGRRGFARTERLERATGLTTLDIDAH